jgi:tRNA(Arg) A34 adenosine deaminase TadA
VKNLKTSLLVSGDGEKRIQAEKSELLNHPLSVLRLIEKIHAHFPEQWQQLLRRPILTNEASSPALQNLIKVAAKRVHFSLDPIESTTDDLTSVRSSNDPDLRLPDPDPPEIVLSIDLVRKLLSPQKKEETKNLPRHQRDREVRAALYLPGDKSVFVFRNQNHKMKTWHAEMLLLRYFNYQLPNGAILFTSLKPCRMCAAWITESISSSPSMDRLPLIVYLQNDPGRLAQNTTLDKRPQDQKSWEEFKREIPEIASLFSHGENELTE